MGVNYVTGNADYDGMPDCAKTNSDGECELFIQLTVTAALAIQKKPWWKFW